jgi:hypothetical protein
LLRISNVDGDLGGTKVRQGGSGVVRIINPLYRLWLTTLPTGGSDGSGGLCSVRVSGQMSDKKRKARKGTHINGRESRRQGCGQGQQESSGTHCRGE